MSVYHRSPSARSDQSIFFRSRSFDPPPQGAAAELPPGRLLIHVIEAKQLHNPRLFGHLDPFCRLTVGKHVLKTEVTPNSDQPKWDFSEGVDIQGNESKLIVEVFHKGIIGHRSLGRADISLSDLLANPAARWYQLYRNDDFSGSISIKAKFQPTTVGSPLSGAQDNALSANIASPPAMVAFNSPQSMPGGMPSRYDSAYVALPAAVDNSKPPASLTQTITTVYTTTSSSNTSASSSSSSSQPTVPDASIDDIRSNSFRRLDTASSITSDQSDGLGFESKRLVVDETPIAAAAPVVDTQLPTAFPAVHSASTSSSSRAFQPFSAKQPSTTTTSSSSSAAGPHIAEQPIKLPTVIPFGEASYAPIVVPLTLTSAGVPAELMAPLPTFTKPPAGVAMLSSQQSVPYSSSYPSSTASTSASSSSGAHGGRFASKLEGSNSLNKTEKSVSSLSGTEENQVVNIV